MQDILKQFNVSNIDLRSIHSFDKSIAMDISEEVCQYHSLIPVSINDKGELHLAMSNPLDVLAQQIVQSKINRPIQVFYTSAEDIDYAIGEIFSDKASFEDTLQDLIEVDDDDELAQAEESIDLLRSQASDAPAVVFVNTILVQAVQERSSDIHIEPQENNLRIRLRVDGVLREFTPADKRLQQGVIARIKILADLDIAESRVPQDGRVKIKVMGRAVDLRVSTLPGIYGEKIVLRILDKGSTSLNINDMGLNEDNLVKIKDHSQKAQGMILVTGPTGSGKTTSLYSVLNYVNSPEKNIITIEDPVEYRLAGINQIQARASVGLTFASALRSILRQDPDIVMVGEIRDFETAEIAIKAALTGHLVLSTLHTNDAVATIIRLLNMGVDKFLVASSVSVIMAQRLVRRICLSCKEKTKMSSEIVLKLKSMGQVIPEKTFWHGKGCQQCSGTGYWGRVAIHEVLFMADEIKDMIVKNAPELEIRRAAKTSGMISLLEDGLEKAQKGATTIKEILRVV